MKAFWSHSLFIVCFLVISFISFRQIINANMSSDDDYEEEVEEVTDLSNQAVVTKYRTASDIANKTLQGILTKCKPGTGLSILALGLVVVYVFGHAFSSIYRCYNVV